MVRPAPAAAHGFVLRGAALGGAAPRGPLVVQRTDQDLVDALLRELGDPALWARVLASVAAERDAGGTLRLFQPVHRTFHLVVVEAVCDEFGEPRVDPARFDGAGLVIRRVAPPPPAAARARLLSFLRPADRARLTGGEAEWTYGWMRDESRVLGWVPLSDPQRDRDPDPERRPPELSAGNAVVTRALRDRLGTPDHAAETVSPLFPAPPEVCRAAGKTLLFGVVPLASSEFSDAPGEPEGWSEADAAELLPPWLKAGSHQWESQQEHGDPALAGALRLLEMVGLVNETPAALAFVAALDRVPVTYGEAVRQGQRWVYPHHSTLGQEVRRAALAVETPPGPRRRDGRMRWTLSATQAAEALRAAKGALDARAASVTPRQGRYDNPLARYRMRAFVRIRRCADCPCPPDLVWTPESEPFTIVPWFETAGLPPVRVTLPDPTPEAMKKLKPNVAFVTPKRVADKMAGLKMDDLVKGNAPGGGGPGLDWICGFNIPIITLCAFLVLNIFLSLLNILFWWLPFVKICIPIPRSQPPKSAPPP